MQVTHKDHVKTARSMMNYANQLACLIMSKYTDPRTEAFQLEMNQRWKPAHDRAWAYAHAHNISKHQL